LASNDQQKVLIKIQNPTIMTSRQIRCLHNDIQYVEARRELKEEGVVQCNITLGKHGNHTVRIVDMAESFVSNRVWIRVYEPIRIKQVRP